MLAAADGLLRSCGMAVSTRPTAVPSLFNGALFGASRSAFLAATAVAGFFELQQWSMWAERENETWIEKPRASRSGRPRLRPARRYLWRGCVPHQRAQDAGIKNGRLAMMAITGFAVQDSSTERRSSRRPFFFGRWLALSTVPPSANGTSDLRLTRVCVCVCVCVVCVCVCGPYNVYFTRPP